MVQNPIKCNALSSCIGPFLLRPHAKGAHSERPMLRREERGDRKICVFWVGLFRVKINANGYSIEINDHSEEGPMELVTVTIEKPEEVNVILGQSHFIKTVEDI